MKESATPPFRIANSARFVDLLAGQADFWLGRFNVSVWNICRPALFGYFIVSLCPVVFISNPSLGLRFDFQRIGLR
jgi:hypothetical protein